MSRNVIDFWFQGQILGILTQVVVGWCMLEVVKVGGCVSLDGWRCLKQKAWTKGWDNLVCKDIAGTVKKMWWKKNFENDFLHEELLL